MKKQIQEKLECLPSEPGVYLMKDEKQCILYVGKAKNLKNRVKSYFRGENQLSIRTADLVKHIHDFDIMIVQTEKDALLLERTLIKHHAPKYNVLLRDDKEYPLLKVNLQDTWPIFEKVRNKNDENSLYLGPFTEVGQLNFSIDAIYEVFPLVRCSPYELENSKRPCNYYHMKKCLAPCSLTVDREFYREMVLSAVEVLRGNNKKAIEILKEKMLIAAEKENFEMAAVLRDQMLALQNMQVAQSIVTEKLKNADVIGYFVHNDEFSVEVLFVRDHHLVGSVDLNLPCHDFSEEEILYYVLSQFYENKSVPEVLVLPKKSFLNADLDLILNKKIRYYYASSSDECDRLIKLAQRNARQKILEKEASHLKNFHTLNAVKVMLGMEGLPKVIECYDISHIQGTATVGSQVVFVNGKPDKSRYRLYNLKNESSKPDDYASLKEVLSRRLEHCIQDGEYPDLMIIDGGLGQLHAVEEVFFEKKITRIKLVSLAKSRTLKSDHASALSQKSSERVFTLDAKKPIELIVGSPVYRLFTQLRDEAHRFAIFQHRKVRKKVRQGSGIEGIPGIGGVLRKRILMELDYKEIAQSNPESLSKRIKGLNRDVAQKLIIFCQKNLE